MDTQRKPGASNGNLGRLPDLHNPDMDTVGRVDVLVARGLKLAIGKTRDPVLQGLYGTFQPMLDALIFDVCKPLNRSRVARAIRAGRRKVNPDVRRARAKRRADNK